MLSASRDPTGGRARRRPEGVSRPGAWGLAARSAASLLVLATKLGTSLAVYVRRGGYVRTSRRNGCPGSTQANERRLDPR